MLNLFRPPKFEDDLKTDQAVMLHFVLLVSIALPIPYAFFMILIAKDNPWEILAQVLTAILIDLALLVILHKGYVKLAAWFQSLAFWAFFSILAATTSGVRGPGYLVGSGMVIVLAGALIGSHGALIITSLVCLTGGSLVYAETQGLLTFSLDRTPLSTWIISSMLFPITATVQNLASTRLRRALQRAHTSEVRNQAIVNALPDLIFRFGKDKTFLDYHAPEGQSLLISPTQFINQPIASVLSPELAEITSTAIDRIFATEQIQVYEYSLPMENGTRYYESRMVSCGEDEIMAIVRDITEQYETEEQIKKLNEELEQRILERTSQLQESEQRFRTLFESSPDGLFLLDPHHPEINWPIVDCNEAACRMNGYTRDELIGQPLDIIHTFTETRENRQNFLEAFRRNKRNVLEITHRRKDDSLFPIETSVKIVKMSGKEYVLGIDRDITERKHVEATLAKQKIDLELANKELETFSYSVSHDLRAPLRSISGFGKILRDDFSQSLDPLAQNYLNRMIESAGQLNELIDGILKISRLSHVPLKPIPLDLSQMSNEVIAALREHDPHRQVTVQIQAGITAVADSTLMHNVLENLLGNAWKYTAQKEQAEISFGVTSTAEQTIYFVRDNGSGFDMAYADKLFGPFQRLHHSDEFPGHGIGLASVQRIIHKHNGKIWAEAEVGKGATFYFTLG